jgi:hypothetical protein
MNITVGANSSETLNGNSLDNAADTLIETKTGIE